RKTAASMNPRGDKKSLDFLDAGCLRLQVKVLLALEKARDAHYNPKAPENIVSLNVAPPVQKDGVSFSSGGDPKAIQDPEARKAYEDAIAANQQRAEKMNREMELSRGVDYAVIDIWHFLRNFPANSNARKQAFTLVNGLLTDDKLRQRIGSAI